MQPAFLLLPVVVSKKPAFSSHKINKFQRQEFEKKVSEKDSVRQITEWINNLCEKEKKTMKKKKRIVCRSSVYSFCFLFVYLIVSNSRCRIKTKPILFREKRKYWHCSLFWKCWDDNSKRRPTFLFFFCLLKIMIENWYLKV